MSVTFEQAVKRLHDICGVEISEAHLATIANLRKHRNRISHFAISIDEEVAISLVAKKFTFALEFVTVHIQR